MKEQFEDTIRAINTCMHRYGSCLRANEALTRSALIDPLLVSLGWRLHDPGQVIPEYRPFNGKRQAVDYLLVRDSFSMIIESKALDINLEPCEQELIDYVTLFQEADKALSLCCLTNGDIWNIYEPYNMSERVAELSITSHSLEHCIEILAQWKLLKFRCHQRKSPTGPLEGTIPITGIRPLDGLVAPRAIVFSDGQERKLKAWKDVKQHTYEKLELRLPKGYSVRKRSHSSQVLKDTSRLLYHHNRNPSETYLIFS